MQLPSLRAVLPDSSILYRAKKIKRLPLSLVVKASAALGVVLSATSAHAASLIVPSLTVLGTNVFAGPTFTVGQNYLSTDLLSINVAGTVDLASGDFTTNAAGIIVAPTVTNTGNTPGQFASNGSSRFGALLIGNTNLGFFTVFPANASTGLGSATPPTALALTTPLSSVFTNAGFNGLAAGTQLELRVSDTDTFNNSGAFVVSAAAAPEPGTVALCALPILGLVARRARRVA